MTRSQFNEEEFLASLADDRELACELVAAFFEDCPKRTQSLADALAANDAVRASKMAHSLKGMCGVLRADGLSRLALNMEHAARQGRLDKVRGQFAEFQEQLDDVFLLLNNFVTKE